MTQTAKHTPGPWLYTGVFDAGESVGYSVHQAETAPHPIAHDIQNEADARLIAAAPALLDGARVVIDRWTRGDLAEAVRMLDIAVTQAT